MTREELLPIALKHGFGHCEVGIRMLGLVEELLAAQRERLADYFDEMPGREMFGGTIADEIRGMR